MLISRPESFDADDHQLIINVDLKVDADDDPPTSTYVDANDIYGW